MNLLPAKKVALVVAHPDDETLWAGGTMLGHPEWHCFIACLCRGSDQHRAANFRNMLTMLHATGSMGDLNDQPEQTPLAEHTVQQLVLTLLPVQHFDLIITHNPTGEYTKHLRHEETSRAVITLWHAGKISAGALWTFAYEDGVKAYYPRAVPNATICQTLSESIWNQKYKMMTETYHFEKDSWEAQTTPQAEAFWQFLNPYDALQWLNKGGILA